jgi:hypothetical protein
VIPLTPSIGGPLSLISWETAPGGEDFRVLKYVAGVVGTSEIRAAWSIFKPARSSRIKPLPGSTRKPNSLVVLSRNGPGPTMN